MRLLQFAAAGAILPGLAILIWAFLADRQAGFRDLWRSGWTRKLIAIAIGEFFVGCAVAVGLGVAAVWP